jgi:hypothetical protein
LFIYHYLRELGAFACHCITKDFKKFWISNTVYTIRQVFAEWHGIFTPCLKNFKITYMNNLFRGLLAGAGAAKFGGGCLGTVLVFAIIWALLGTCDGGSHAYLKTSERPEMTVCAPAVAHDTSTPGTLTVTHAASLAK